MLLSAERAAASPEPADVEHGLSDEQVAALPNEQDRYALVLRYYLAGRLSTGRLVELPGLTWPDVRARFARLGLPFSGPESAEELADEVRSVKAWLRHS